MTACSKIKDEFEESDKLVGKVLFKSTDGDI